jgi:hypothetical protein
MNGFEQKQVTRALDPEVIPTKPLSDFEKKFLESVKKYRWPESEHLSLKQSKVLNNIMKKF